MPELFVTNMRLCLAEQGTERVVLDIPELRLRRGELVGLAGASGSGKTSLLNVLAGIVVPTRGSVFWGNCEINTLPEAARDRWRGRYVGFIFQDFRLFQDLTALENVLLPVTFHAVRVPKATADRARSLLSRMEIARDRKVRLLSRGERQRVAIARAVLAEPCCLLADEPTASLDAANAAMVSEFLTAFAKELGSTLILVSHDAEVLARMESRLVLQRGVLSGTGPAPGPAAGDGRTSEQAVWGCPGLSPEPSCTDCGRLA